MRAADSALQLQARHCSLGHATVGLNVSLCARVSCWTLTCAPRLRASSASAT